MAAVSRRIHWSSTGPCRLFC